MDNQDQNPVGPQPQNPESRAQSTNSNPLSNQKTRKVLQPSEALIKDMASNPVSLSAHESRPTVSVTPNTQAPNSVAGQTPVPTAKYNPSTIYPEATSGLLSDPSENNQVDKQPIKPNKNNLTKLIILGVIALGIFIAVPAILSIISSVKIISYGGISVLGKAGGLIYLIDAIYLMVGIGLILRRELARISYVVIGVILLLIALYGTINYFRASHGISGPATIYAEETRSDQTAVNGDKASIANYQNSTSLPASEKQQIISSLENELAQDQQQLKQDQQLQKKNTGVNVLVELIPTYLLAILPLVFLTRPRVIEVFS